MDGDGRGGAALSMRAVTGKPIRFVGLGEKMDALEEFRPEQVAGRILGMGDIVALVEKAQETLEAEAAERMMKRFQKGQFNMNDLKAPARSRCRRWAACRASWACCPAWARCRSRWTRPASTTGCSAARSR